MGCYGFSENPYNKIEQNENIMEETAHSGHEETVPYAEEVVVIRGSKYFVGMNSFEVLSPGASHRTALTRL